MVVIAWAMGLAGTKRCTFSQLRRSSWNVTFYG